MASYIITYDLAKPDRNYPKLIEGIKKLTGTWARPVQSTWIVAGNEITCVYVRDTLRQLIDANDKLFVARLTGESAWTGLGGDESAWLKNNLQ